MRFILSFIFFGLLFYALYLYAPNVFETLVSWTAAIFNFVHGLIDQISSGKHT